MKASRTLLFILSVFLLLGLSWFVFPADGLALGGLELRFPSYAQDRMGEEEDLDVDAFLDEVSKSFEMSCSETLLDSLEFFRDYLTINPNRIYLPLERLNPLPRILVKSLARFVINCSP